MMTIPQGSEIPYVISEELIRFNCPMNELSMFKVARSDDGSIDYCGCWPEKECVLVPIECVDGLVLLIWCPK